MRATKLESEKRSGSPSRVAPAVGSARVPMNPTSVLALQRAIGNKGVSRRLAEDEHVHGAGGGHGAGVQRRVSVENIVRSAGRPLPNREKYEAEFNGADFSRVRLHDDLAARRSAAELNASAYTTRNHVVLGEGRVDDKIVRHELTHFIQQEAGEVEGTDRGDGMRVSDPFDRHERQATANENGVTAEIKAVAASLSAGAAGTAGAEVAPDSASGSSAPTTAQRAAREPETSVVQLFTEETSRTPGFTNFRMSRSGDYIIVGSDDEYSDGVWVRRGRPKPRYCQPTVHTKKIDGHTYVKYIPLTTFLKDCSHTAEEVMHMQTLEMGQAASKFAGTTKVFGNSNLENVEAARAYARSRNGGSDRQSPQVGQAFATVETEFYTDDLPANESGYPYHVAAVVAVDGEDQITIEQFAGRNDARHGDGHPAFFNIYTAGHRSRNFHARYRQFFTRGITVTLAVTNERRLRPDPRRGDRPVPDPEE